MKTIPDNLDLNDIPTEKQTVEHTIYDILKDARIDLSQEIPPPPTALKIGGEIFGTLGNFSLAIGKAKSKKTFLMTLAMAGALGSNGIFEGCLPPDKKRVVFCDTEQGKYHVLKAGKNVLRLLNADHIPETFDVFALRSFDTHTRLEMIEAFIQSTPDLGILVIDGIKDLISSINDESEATTMADNLLRWTELYSIHIITVLHQNKSDKNARGHIGTELQNKAETVISVEKEPKTEVSKVEVEYSRNKEFQPFGFMVNMHGLPEIVKGWKPKETDKAKSKGITPDEIDDFKHNQIIREIASKCTKPSNSELMEQIKLAVGKHCEQIGDSKAKTFKQFYLNEGYIQHNGKERSPSAYYSIITTRVEDES